MIALQTNMVHKTFSKPFDQFLPHSELNARIARLAVHYRDLQFEARAIAASELPELDFSGVEFRHVYFIRRVVGTLFEFTCALEHLNQSQEFKTIRKQFKPDELAKWNSAIAFFQTHKGTFKNARDDVGAHFQSKITDYSTRNIDSAAIAKIELLRGNNDKFAINFGFVDELIATALTARKGTKTSDEFIHHLIRLTREGHRFSSIIGSVIYNYFTKN